MKTETLYDLWSPVYDFAHHLQTLWADDLHRLLAITHARLQDRNLVLDIGTGTGLTAKMASKIHPFTYILGIDLSGGMLEESKINLLNLNVKVVKTNAEQMPFPDNLFDAVISVYGFGGIKNPEKAMDEVVRVVKPNSRISFAEMTEPPSQYPIKRFVHNYFVEPWIKFWWDFRDLDYEKLFTDHGIKIDHNEFRSDRSLGSTTIISGYLDK